MARKPAAEPPKTVKVRRAPRPRTPPKPDPLRQVTAEEVWQACPPLGGPAETTRDITDRLGLAHATPVLQKLHALAEVGRVQRLHRGGSERYWWRRQ